MSLQFNQLDSGSLSLKLPPDKNQPSGMNNSCSSSTSGSALKSHPQDSAIKNVRDVLLSRSFSLSSMEEDTLENEPKGFVKVKGKKRRCNDPIQLDLTTFETQGFNNNNRFQILGEIEMDKTNNEFKDAHKQKKSVKPAAESYCPPIFIYNLNIKSLVDQLKAKNVDFKIINKSRFKSKLYVRDPRVHQEMMALLKEKCIESYSFTPKAFKKINIILRGLYFKTDIGDIKRELDLILPNTVDVVSKFHTKFSRKFEVDTSLFLVTLLPGKNANDFTHIRYLLSQSVSWESPKANSREVQCWRCQQWGHYSSNCNRPQACVKCSEKHGPGECKLVVNNSSKPFCVNCKTSGHPANWRGCPYFLQYSERKRELTNVIRERNLLASQNVQNARIDSSLISSNKTFANCFNISQKTVKASKKPPFVEEFLKIAKEICKEETMSLEDKIRSFIGNYKNCSRPQAKSDCLKLLKEIESIYGN